MHPFENNALIGYTGFVGTTLTRQTAFNAQFRSTNIAEIAGKAFDLVICAGAPAQKWLANKAPADDLAGIEGLMKHLERVSCQTFVLISTVDVFRNPVGVDEDTLVTDDGLHAYGKHRRMLEIFARSHFPQSLTVRLPGLVGPGLRKNIVFDLLNDNNLDAIDSRGVFQFYPMVNLWYDIQLALQAALPLVHLTAAPVSVADIASEGFNRAFAHQLPAPASVYDMRTKYSAIWGQEGGYQYSRRESIQAIRAYAQSEPAISERSK